MTRSDHFTRWHLAATDTAHFDALVALIASVNSPRDSLRNVTGTGRAPSARPTARPTISTTVSTTRAAGSAVGDAGSILDGAALGDATRTVLGRSGAGEGQPADSSPICWAAGATAAALFQVDGFELAPPFELVIERNRNIVRLGHVVHRSLFLDPIDRVAVGPIYATSPTRTLIDLAARRDPVMLTRVLDSMLRDRLTSEGFLHRRIVALRGKGRYGIPTLLRVIEGSEVTRGGHSWLERQFLAEVAAAGLPRPEVQQVLARRGAVLVRVDCRFPGTPVVVELLGYRFHRTQAQMQVDAQRMNALMLQGFLPLQFTYVDVVESMPAVLDTVRRALAPYL